jgi:predicted MFS family arabinose efflux permease
MASDTILEPPLRRNPNYLRLLAAGIASSSGQSMAFTCLIWLVYTQTGSALAVAYVGVVNTLVALAVSLPSGTLADRYDRRRLMILTDLIRAGALASVGVAFLLDGFVLWFALVLIAAITAAGLPFNMAEQSILPTLVGPGRVADANGLVHSSRSAVGFVGAAIAGLVIVGAGAVAGLLYNSLTYVVSAVLIALIVTRRPGESRPADASEVPVRAGFLHQTLEGFRWLRSSRGLMWLTFSALFLNFFSSMSFPFLVVYVTTVLHGSAITFGLMGGLLALGDILGALSVGRLRSTARGGRAWLLGYLLAAGISVLGFVLFPNVYVACSLAAVAGWGLGYATTAWLSSAQILVPSAMQGRYFGVDALGSSAIVPVGTLLGGVLIGTYGVVGTFWISGTGVLLGVLGFALVPALWNLRAVPGEGAGARPLTPG